MQLDERSRIILSAAQLRGNIGHRRIGELTGYPAHQVRRTLQFLEEQEIIQPYTLINKFPLGFLKFGVFFSLCTNDPESTNQVIKQLCQINSVVSVIELFGEYQYFMSIAACSIVHSTEILQEISNSIGDIVFEKTIAIRVSLTLFRRKYLSTQSTGLEFLKYKLSNQKPSINEVDYRIINILAEQGHPNSQEISNSTGIAHSTVHNRIKQLEKLGIIVGYPYSIDPMKIGMLPYDLLLTTRELSNRMEQQLHEFGLHNSYIVGLTHCIGPWDYEIRIEVPSPRQATEITQAIYRRFKGDIIKIRTLTIGKELKYMKTQYLELQEKHQ